MQSAIGGGEVSSAILSQIGFDDVHIGCERLILAGHPGTRQEFSRPRLMAWEKEDRAGEALSDCVT